MSKKIPELRIPPGTTIELDGIGRVTLTFPLIIEAEAFVEWLQWLDSAEQGQKLEVFTRQEIKQ